MRALLLVASPLAALWFGLDWYAGGGRWVETDNAYVKARIIAVSADVSGRVVEVAARDNHPVAAGALLFRIDPEPFRVALTRAEAQLALVRTELETLRAEHRGALAEAREAEERIAFLSRQLERQRRLIERGMVREASFDEARHDLAVAHSRLDAARERAARALASLAGEADGPVQRHPRTRQALAAREAAVLDLERTQVRAAAAGIVSRMALQPGEHVARGTPVFSLIEDAAVWVEANYKETQLTHMREGQPARVVADAYPEFEFAARLARIAPATGAEFALLPPQNATGNWIKVVQRVPVLIHLAEGDDRPRLRAGMTVTVSVDTGRERGLPRFLNALR